MSNAIGQHADQLNAALQRLEETLVWDGQNTPANIFIDAPEAMGRLSFGPTSNSYVLMWTTPAAPPLPLVKATLAVRLAAVDALPRLLKAMREAQDARIVEVVDAIEVVETLIKNIRGH